MENAVLNALSFNAIKSFNEREKEVDTAILKAIADTFVRHNMQIKLERTKFPNNYLI